MDKRIPPGLRFHPTDKELLLFYLRRKNKGKKADKRIVIRELNIYNLEPWELPTFSIHQFFGRISESSSTQEKGRGEVKEDAEEEGGEEDGEEGEEEESQKDCYVFHTLDRKYHRGSRSNRATCKGYWKATGKDKKVFSSSSPPPSSSSSLPRKQVKLLGTKKTLVFYQGRAPHGNRTDWVMHEYQLAEEEEEGGGEDENNSRSLVLCRIRKKSKLGDPSSPRENPIANPSSPCNDPSSPHENPMTNPSSPCNTDTGNVEGNVGKGTLGFGASSSSTSSLALRTNNISRPTSGGLDMICRAPNLGKGSIQHPYYTFLSL